MQDVNKLQVYGKALDLATDIYTIKYPQHELYALQSQIRRAATSISLNISEGTGRLTQADFKNFLVMARGSSKEVITCLELSKRLNYIDYQTYTSLTDKTEHVAKMLSSLINAVGSK